MADDSSSGGYYNVLFNENEIGVDHNTLGHLHAHSSIFHLFPSLQLSLVNKENELIFNNELAVGTPVSVDLGISSLDSEFEEYRNFVIEYTKSINSRDNLGGQLACPLINKNAQSLITSSDERGYQDKLSSDVIKSVLKDYDFPEKNIEKTENKGNWISPSCESDYTFLKILKNRSSTSNSSKMFMWVDLHGNFHFKSLTSLLKQEPIHTLDFTKDGSELYIATNFTVINTGLRYREYEINENFKEYVFNKSSQDDLDPLSPREYVSASSDHKTIKDLNTFKKDNPILYNYSHSKLPLKYNQAKYLNSYKNLPITISFKIKNIDPNVFLPGNVLKLTFPYGGDRTEHDPIYSGNYLITTVHKQIINKVFTVDIECMTDSVYKDGTFMLFSEESKSSNIA
jgi:hypothetical protein